MSCTTIPQCRWLCDDPECEADCKHYCEAPKCEYQCQSSGQICPGLPNCHIECNDCIEPDSCPQCEIKCEDPQCDQCDIVCQAPECSWDCQKPKNCPEPHCELQCESYACPCIPSVDNNMCGRGSSSSYPVHVKHNQSKIITVIILSSILLALLGIGIVAIISMSH